MPLSFEEFLRRSQAGEDPSTIFGEGSAGGPSALDTPYAAPAAAPSAAPTHGPFRTAWDYVSSPVKALFGLTGGAIPYAFQSLFPDSYRKAQAELEASQPQGLFPEAQALPALGDVAVQGMSPEFRGSTAGQVLEPVTRLGLNILGDPTTYIGGIGAFTKAGKAVGAWRGAMGALKAAETAGDAAKVAHWTEAARALERPAMESLGAESKLGRMMREVGAPGASGTAAADLAASPTVRNFSRLGARLPFSPIAGLAYGPELVESLYTQGQAVAEDAQAGRYADAAAKGTGALLTAGLGALVAHGTITELRAANILKTHVDGVRPRPLPESAAAGPAAATPAADLGAVPGLGPEAPPAATEVPLTGTPPSQPAQGGINPAVAGGPVPINPAADMVTPLQETAPAPQPIEGYDRIQVAKTPAEAETMAQALRDLIQKKASAGELLTKRDLAGMGVPKYLLKKRGAGSRPAEFGALIDAIAGPEEGPKIRARLEYTEGLGYKVRPGEAAVAAAAPAPLPVPEPVPLPAPPPAAAAAAAAATIPMAAPASVPVPTPAPASIADLAALLNLPPEQLTHEHISSAAGGTTAERNALHIELARAQVAAREAAASAASDPTELMQRMLARLQAGESLADIKANPEGPPPPTASASISPAAEFTALRATRTTPQGGLREPTGISEAAVPMPAPEPRSLTLNTPDELASALQEWTTLREGIAGIVDPAERVSRAAEMGDWDVTLQNAIEDAYRRGVGQPSGAGLPSERPTHEGTLRPEEMAPLSSSLEDVRNEQPTPRAATEAALQRTAPDQPLLPPISRTPPTPEDLRREMGVKEAGAARFGEPPEPPRSAVEIAKGFGGETARDRISPDDLSNELRRQTWPEPRTEAGIRTPSPPEPIQPRVPARTPPPEQLRAITNLFGPGASEERFGHVLGEDADSIVGQVRNEARKRENVRGASTLEEVLQEQLWALVHSADPAVYERQKARVLEEYGKLANPTEAQATKAINKLAWLDKRYKLVTSDATDPVVRKDLTAWLLKDLKGEEKNYFAAEKEGKLAGPGKRMAVIDDLIKTSIFDGFSPEEVLRSADSALLVREAVENAKFDLPTRPAGMSEAAYKARVALDPSSLKTPDSIRKLHESMMAVAREQALFVAKGKKSGNRPTLFRDQLKKVAAHVGVEIPSSDNFEDAFARVGKAVQKLAADVAETPESAASARLLSTTLLTPEAAPTRGAQWKRAQDTGLVIDPEGRFRVADAEHDTPPDLLASIAQSTGPDFHDLADRVLRDAAVTIDTPGTVYRGDLASPQLGGINVGGDQISINSHNAYFEADRMVPADAPNRRALVVDRATKNFLDDGLHEILHKRAVGHGGDYIKAFEQAMKDIAPSYGELHGRMQGAFDARADAIAANMPAYRANAERLGLKYEGQGAGAGEAAGRGAGAGAPGPVPGLAGLAGLEGADAGAGPRGSPPLLDRPGLGTPDALRGVEARLRSPEPVRGGGERPAAGVGGPAALGEGAAPGGDQPSGGRGFQEVRGVQPEPGGKPAAQPTASAHILTPVLNALRDQNTEDVIGRIGASFIRNLASLQAPGGGDAETLFRRVAASLSDPQRAALREAGPGKLVDIPLNLKKYLADSLSDEQKEGLALSMQMNEALNPRGTVSWDMVDAESRRLLGVRTPEEWVKVAQKSGIHGTGQMAMFRSITSLYMGEVDRASVALTDAIRANAPAPQLDVARQALDWAVGRRDAAIGVVTIGPGGSRETARVLGLLRSIAHPAGLEETFASRFKGALHANGIKEEKTREKLYQMFLSLKDQGAGASWKTLTDAFREANDPSRFSKFIEFWKAGLLGIPTQIVNVTGNLGFFGLRQAESAVSVLADKFFSGLTGAPRRRFVSEISGRVSGMKQSIGEALRFLGSDLNDIAHLREPSLRAAEEGSFLDPNFQRLQGAIGGKWGEFIRSPFKSLDAFDNFFKHVLRNQEFGAQSARLAQDVNFRSPGESISHAQSRILDEIRLATTDPLLHTSLFNRYSKEAVKRGYDDVFLKAKKVAEQDTFQTPLNDTMRKLYDLSVAHPSFQLFVPFFKTPYNILSEGMKRTPLGALWAIAEYKKGKISPEFMEATVKSTVGSLIMLTAAEAALSGVMTGGGPSDPKEQQIKRRTGWQPYSFKIGNQYISYQRLEPFATLLGIAADMAEAWAAKDIQTGSDLLEKGIASATENITNKTFTTGISSIMDIVTGSSGDRAAALRSLEASLIPNIIGVVPFAHAARAMDPNYRETKDSLVNPLIAQIPFASQTLQPQRKPTGEVRERPGTPIERLLSPIARSTVQTGPIAEAASEISRLGFSPSAIEPYFRVGTSRIYYTTAERETIGQAQQKGMVAVARFIRSPEYRRLPDQETLGTEGQRTKKQAIQALLTRYRQPAAQHAERQALSREKRQPGTGGPKI